jgi:hypothetical protein
MARFNSLSIKRRIPRIRETVKSRKSTRTGKGIYWVWEEYWGKKPNIKN